MNFESRHPSVDEINKIIQDARTLRSQAFNSFMSKLASSIKGAVYPKAPRATGKVA